MTRVASKSMIRQIESLFGGGSVAGLSDRQLLERFNERRCDPEGEAAFETLVARHGPMVLGVCRHIVGDAQLAEDAFQAVFLVLAQKARTIGQPDLLGNWLYGVAMRTARCARQKIARSRRREERDAMNGPGAGLSQVTAATASPAELATIDREQAEAIHGEVERLPRLFRLPVVLCYFEGLTLDEAAKRLRCPSGTLRSRLARAREKLRLRLSRRGFALPAVALAAILVPRSTTASISPLLRETTTRAAIAFTARHAASVAVTARAATLAQEVLRNMLVHNLSFAVVTVLGLGALATGAGLATHSLAAKDDAMKGPMRQAAVGRGSPDPALNADRRSPEPEPARTEPRARVETADRARGSGSSPADRMMVAGRVLDSDGKPVNSAVVDLVAAARIPWVAAAEQIEQYQVLGQCQCEGDGQFRLDAPRMASARVLELGIVAAAPGYGLGWVALNPDSEAPTAEVRLRREEPIRVRFVELSGVPAKGVGVRVLSLSQPDEKGKVRWIGIGRSRSGTLRSWPRPLTTDNDGKITLGGLGSGTTACLEVSDLPYARQEFYVESGKSLPGKETTLALRPGRIIEGRVLAADTGQPIPNAIVSAETFVESEHARGFFTSKFRVDKDGRFIMNPIAGEKYTLGAFPTGGEPYLIQQDEFTFNKAQIKATRDITLRRGVLIRGKVNDAATGRPLAASSIQYIPVGGNDRVLSGWQAIVASDDAGSFHIAVSAGKGHLLVFGPTGDYVLSEIGSSRLYSDRPGGQRYRAHAIIPYEVKAGDAPHDVAAVLRPGVTIKGRVEGPDGQTITEASIITTLYIEAFNPSWRGDFQVPVRDDRFELHGLAPDASARIYILDSEHECGATVDVSGKAAGEDLTIRLQPCGKAVARFVGPDRKPLVGFQPHLEFVATPGPSPYRLSEQDRDALTADADFASQVDRKHHSFDQRTDADGRFSMIALVPGALYRIMDRSTINEAKKGAPVPKDFTVKAGETLDLGDILIEKPQAR
jgi:RNA polymerase sigma factor (sigma-70 family)